MAVDDFDGALFLALVNYLIFLNSRLDFFEVLLLLLPLGLSASQLATTWEPACAMQNSQELVRLVAQIKQQPEIIPAPSTIVVKNIPLVEHQWSATKAVALAATLNVQPQQLHSQPDWAPYGKFAEAQRLIYPDSFFLYGSVDKKLLVENYQFYRWFTAANRNLNEEQALVVFREIYRGETAENLQKILRSALVQTAVLNQKFVEATGLSLQRRLEIPVKDEPLLSKILRVPDADSKTNIFTVGQMAADNIVAAAAYAQEAHFDLNSPEHRLLKTTADACIQQGGLEATTSHVEAKHVYRLASPQQLANDFKGRFRHHLDLKTFPEADVKACVLMGHCSSEEEAALREVLAQLNTEAPAKELRILVCENPEFLD